MKKVWTDEAWEDYISIQNDKQLLKKANKRIDDYNRIVYRLIDENTVEIVQCGTHYHK